MLGAPEFCSNGGMILTNDSLRTAEKSDPAPLSPVII